MRGHQTDYKNSCVYQSIMEFALRTTEEEAERVIEDHQQDRSSDHSKTPPQVESAMKAETGDVIRKENQRLKMYLEEIMKDYSTLQKQIQGKAQQQRRQGKDHEEQEESELISLSLGRSSSSTCTPKKDAFCKGSTNWEGDDNGEYQEDLVLGLDLNTGTAPYSGGSTTQAFPSESSPATSSEAPEKRTVGDDEASELKPLKKARVCVRTRCDTPTMNDGCHWRKYGQKIAKGNPCPRAYYRCTIAPSCPVRKQVQRCANELSVLLTTYEGTHNHPLPMSATAMASTTSAAASMLLCGSSSSQQTAASASASLHGVNFYMDNSKRKPSYYFSDTSMSSSSFPTITLDLTSPQTSFSSPLNRFSPSSNINPPRYSSPALNFNSSEPYAMSWGNGFLGYGSYQPSGYNSNLGTINSASPTLQNVYQSPHIQNKSSNTLPQHSLTQEAVAAATEAITADPRFQSALAAALSSVIGSTDHGSNSRTVTPGHQIGGGNISQRLNKWSDQLYTVPSTLQSTSTKVNVSASNILNKAASTNINPQPGGLLFLPPASSFAFAGSNQASSRNGDNKSSPN